MPFIKKDQLEMMGFKSLGTNVRISEKASIYWTVGSSRWSKRMKIRKTDIQ
jgi:hypothetical protein